jgi:hypothetical protein
MLLHRRLDTRLVSRGEPTPKVEENTSTIRIHTY